MVKGSRGRLLTEAREPPRVGAPSAASNATGPRCAAVAGVASRADGYATIAECQRAARVLDRGASASASAFERRPATQALGSPLEKQAKCPPAAVRPIQTAAVGATQRPCQIAVTASQQPNDERVARAQLVDGRVIRTAL